MQWQCSLVTFRAPLWPRLPGLIATTASATTVKKYAALRAELKAKKDYIGLSQLPRDASPTRVVNRCQVSGRRRAFIRRFKISRLTFRELASAGIDPRGDEVELVGDSCGLFSDARGGIRCMNLSPSFSPLFAMLAEDIAEHWDSPGVILGKLAAIVALVALNGFFVACEFALVKVRAQPAGGVARGRRQARRGHPARPRPSGHLSFRHVSLGLRWPASASAGWANNFSPGCCSRFSLWPIHSTAVVTSDLVHARLYRHHFPAYHSRRAGPENPRHRQAAAALATTR